MWRRRLPHVTRWWWGVLAVQDVTNDGWPSICVIEVRRRFPEQPVLAMISGLLQVTNSMTQTPTDVVKWAWWKVSPAQSIITVIVSIGPAAAVAAWLQGRTKVELYSLAHPIVHGDFSAKLSGVAPSWWAGSAAIYCLSRFLRLLASPERNMTKYLARSDGQRCIAFEIYCILKLNYDTLYVKSNVAKLQMLKIILVSSDTVFQILPNRYESWIPMKLMHSMRFCDERTEQVRFHRTCPPYFSYLTNYESPWRLCIATLQVRVHLHSTKNSH